MWGPAIYEQRISTNPKSTFDLCIPLDYAQKAAYPHVQVTWQPLWQTDVHKHVSYNRLVFINWALLHYNSDPATATATNALDLVLRNSSTLLQVKLFSTQQGKKNLTLWQKYPKGNLMALNEGIKQSIG